MDNMEKTLPVEAPAETEKKAPWTLRRLNDDDLWPLLDIIAEVLPEDLADMFLDLSSGAKKIDEVGAAMFVRLLRAVLKDIRKVRGPVYELLSSVSGIPAADIPKMGFGTTPKMIYAIIKNEGGADFLAELSKLSE